MGGVGHHRCDLATDQTREVNHGLHSVGGQRGDLAVAGRAARTAHQPLGGTAEPLKGGDGGAGSLNLCLKSGSAAGHQRRKTAGDEVGARVAHGVAHDELRAGMREGVVPHSVAW